jgi:predicted HicB family RNase H-like nuclease
MQCGALLFKVRRATLADMAKHASKSEQLAVRIEPALRAALEAAAASDRRPVSQYVRNLILDAVDGDRERQGEHVAR